MSAKATPATSRPSSTPAISARGATAGRGHAGPQCQQGRPPRHHALPLPPPLVRAAQRRGLGPLHLTPFGRPHPYDISAAALAPALPNAVDPPGARHRTVVPDEPAD